MEVINSQFEYFSPRPLQSSVHKYALREFTPISAIQHRSAIEFYLPSSDSYYMDLSKSKLIIKAKITDAANADVANNTNVAPVNLTIHSLFSDVDTEVNGKLITDSNGLYPFRSLFETLLTYNKEYLESQGQCEGFYKDTGGQLAVVDRTGANTGLASRGTLFNGSAEVELSGRPHSELFHQPLAIPYNTPIKIRLFPSRDAFVLKTPAPVGQGV